MSEQRINILPELIINQIAAGEVVERPASIVKELVENAIDAGADQIFVTIKNGGKDFISIVDNGIGMNETDARLAVERHATSKILTEEDLSQIQTLGFRGEALASIASISHFELITCHDEQEGATRLQIHGGQLDHVGKTGFARGTKITVQQLFYNTPARLKFLKTTPTEFQHIQSIIIQQAMAQPHIQFRLTHNQQLLLNLPKNQSLEERIYQLFGDQLQEKLIPVQHEEAYLSYQGFLSMASSPFQSKRWQYLFVNRRFVKALSANRAIYQAYQGLLTKTQHPAFFLNIQLAPTEIDVNVHPAKTEIRFRNSRVLSAILTDHLRKTLLDTSHRRFFGEQLSSLATTPPTSRFEKPSDIRQIDLFSESSTQKLQPSNTSKTSIQKQTPLPPSKQTAPSPTGTNPEPIKATVVAIETSLPQAEQSSLPLIKASNKAIVEPKTTEAAVVLPEPPEAIAAVAPIIRPAPFLPEMPLQESSWKLLGCLPTGYAIVQEQEDLRLVHLHAAHECVLFHYYQKSLSQKELACFELELPHLLELSIQDSVLLEQYLPEFQQLGFQIEPFGKNTFSLSQAPDFMKGHDYQKFIMLTLEKIGVFGKRSRKQEVTQEIMEKAACFAAAPETESWETQLISDLLLRLASIPHEGTRYHGQRISFQISHEEIEKRIRSYG